VTLQIYNHEQGSPEWWACRAGIPTASKFMTVMASGRGGGESKTRRAYMLSLVGERLTGKCVEGYTNIHMERGKEMEDEARKLYSMVTDFDPQKVGFMRNGDAGASPDSLVNHNGLLEIKTKLPHLQIECLLDGTLPSEHRAQCQGQLWIAEREWLDFCSYWPGIKLFRVRVERDEDYINKLSAAVDAFNSELLEIYEKVK
jgi:hypothetical protein